jgi:hypothetical protein
VALIQEHEADGHEERDQYLAVLKCTSARHRELDESEYLVIKGARDSGATWKQVAEALGLGYAQSAQQRYAALGRRVAMEE